MAGEPNTDKIVPTFKFLSFGLCDSRGCASIMIKIIVQSVANISC